MIAILDTNILISALLNPHSLPGRIVDEWTEQRFELLTCEDQLAEFKRVSRYAKISSMISASRAGRLVRELKTHARLIESRTTLDICRDPNDNYLLAMAQAGHANFLVSGDKADLLALGRHRSTKIVSVRQFADILGL